MFVSVLLHLSSYNGVCLCIIEFVFVLLCLSLYRLCFCILPAKMSSRGVCVTPGGNLPAKHIIHLVAGHNPAHWKDVIRNTLEEAEDRKFNNIIFPMLGTGEPLCQCLITLQ